MRARHDAFYLSIRKLLNLCDRDKSPSLLINRLAAVGLLDSTPIFHLVRHEIHQPAERERNDETERSHVQVPLPNRSLERKVAHVQRLSNRRVIAGPSAGLLHFLELLLKPEQFVDALDDQCDETDAEIPQNCIDCAPDFRFQ
jgi:hypothetical protein